MEITLLFQQKTRVGSWLPQQGGNERDGAERRRPCRQRGHRHCGSRLKLAGFMNGCICSRYDES